MSSSHPSSKRDPDLFSEIAEPLLVGLWRFRAEVVGLGLLAAGYLLLARRIGQTPAALAVGLLVLGVLATPRTRRWLFCLLVRRHWHRKLERAFALLARERLLGRPPRVAKVVSTILGPRAHVVLGPGHATRHLEKAADQLAAALAVAEVRVERDPRNAKRCTLSLVTSDPFSSGPIPCPWAGQSRTRLWEPLPIGEDELGQVVSVTLFEHNLLAGGEPGSAKSNLLQLLAARAALDPTATLWVLDPKLVELSRWRGVAAGFAGAELSEAVAVLRAVSEEMAARYRLLQHLGSRKVGPMDEMGLHLVLVDEVTAYLASADKKGGADFAGLLWELLARGRAAGIVVVLAAQKPSTEVISSSTRDLVSIRAAFRSTTREASDTILGSGWATRGISAADISPSTPGVCYLLADGPEPIRVRCYHLSDEAIASIARRAEALRR